MECVVVEDQNFQGLGVPVDDPPENSVSARAAYGEPAVFPFPGPFRRTSPESAGTKRSLRGGSRVPATWCQFHSA